MIEIQFFPVKAGLTHQDRWNEIVSDLRTRTMDDQVLVQVMRVVSLKQGGGTKRNFNYAVVYETGPRDKPGRITQWIDTGLALELMGGGYVGKHIVHGRLYFIAGAAGVLSGVVVRDI